jgi:hypothetical protein
METRYLLPHRYKLIGWVLLIVFFTLGVLRLTMGESFQLEMLSFSREGTTKFLSDGDFLFNLKANNFTDEIIMVLLLISLLLTGFSKEKTEDEWIGKIRLESLVWSVYVNTLLLIGAIIFIYGFMFLDVMIVNIATTMILFIIRFNLIMLAEKRKLRKSLI